jgi:hypothetical protein
MVRNQHTFSRTRGCCGGTLIRKTSLLHKIDPTARRSSFADVSEFGHQISGIGFCPIPDHRFPIPDWRRRAASRHASLAALGSISSSRCQTTCTRYGRSRSVQIHDLTNELSSDRQALVDAASDAPSGGARRDRTDDLLLAKQALSQLSYGPFRNQQSGIRNEQQFLMPDI